MKIIIHFILVFFILSCSPSLEESIVRLQENGLLSYEFTGFAGTTDQSYEDYENLKRLSNENLLGLLNKTDNNIFKTYILWALIDKGYNNVEDLFLLFREDTSSMSVMSGCIMSTDIISSAMYNKLQIELYENEGNNYLNEKKALIDSIVLVGRHRDLLFYRVTRSNAKAHNNYSVIKRNAIQGDATSIINLSKFQKVEDLDFLSEQDSLLDDIVLNFPDLRFKNEIKERFLKSSCEDEKLDKFLAGYLMIEDDFKDIKLRIDSICEYYEAKRLYLSAMELSSNRPVKELIIHNWYSYNVIDDIGFRFLEGQTDFDLIEMLLNGIHNGKFEIKFLDEDYDFDLRGNLFDKFMRFPDDVKSSVIISAISRMDSHDIYVLEKISNSINKPSANFRKALLKSIESSNYAFGMFEKLKILIPHIDESSRRELGEIFRNNTNWDTGNWTSHFRKEFKRLQIKV